MEATAPVDTLQQTTTWLLWAMIAGAAAVMALYAILERRQTTGSLLRAAIAPVAGVALGTVYGLAMRSTVFDGESRLVMSIAFLGTVPFAMGALTGALLRPGANVIGAVLLPWATVALSIAAALATGTEGVICSVMALPLLLGAHMESIGAPPHHLTPDPARVEHWRQYIGEHGLRIGIAWQGARNRMDVGRSFPVNLFAPLAAIPGVRLISLQKNDGTEQLESLPPGMQVERLGPDFDSGPTPFWIPRP